MSGSRSARCTQSLAVIVETSLYRTGAQPGPTTKALLRLGNVEDSDLVMPPQEPPTTTGKFVEEVAGRVETTEGLVNELLS